MAGDNFAYLLKNDKKIYFYNNSKIIYFSNQKEGIKMKPYFIHDKNSFTKALQNSKITYGILKSKDNITKDQENYNSNNSNSYKGSISSIESLDLNDILEASHNIIEEPSDIKISKIFTEERFNKRFLNYSISGLDFNLKYLKEDYIRNNIDYFKMQNDWHRQMSGVYKNKDKTYCFISGPEGAGKTTTILKFLNTEEIRRLYFSLKILSNNNFNTKKWKKYSLYESIYTFDSKEEMAKFCDINNLNKIPNSTNLMEFIFNYIKFVFDFFSTNDSKKKKKC